MSAKKDISKEFDKISDGAKQVQKKRKSLTGRIFKWMCLAVGGSLLIVGGVNIGINYNFLQESLKNQLTEVADMSSNTVSNQLSSITAELQQIAYDSGFDDLTDTGTLSTKCFSILSKNHMLTDVKIVNTASVSMPKRLITRKTRASKKLWKPKKQHRESLMPQRI